ncbi:ABC transporter ATP-binding protein [Rhodoferax antarcticus]|uniref:ABC transporter family protein n=1 Tax=Rhodoferax antarcticus ANT.BR TaxID=1111071 RepID=A0A1Q8YEP5_9BURK|nr:ABC transporter ATP-binding protein [Rhodoferax antarcticus]APW48290.1 ABC transporter ATP-binding protein [Rhodoferax antarcticus]OLP06508.1 ABC transporter family protein [Rhodoferax antarcticus ANT.BR]
MTRTFDPQANAASHAPALELKALHKRFDQTEIVRDISLTVQTGERVAIIGPNGAGKSTLFDLISGRHAPSSGQIWLGGDRIDGKKPFEINHKGLSRSFQISQLFPTLSVFENLRCAMLWQQGLGYAFCKLLASQTDTNHRTRALMQRLQLVDACDTPAQHLSYAQQRALELGMALASDPAVLLLDEPTAGMSQSETSHFMTLIAALTPGKTLLIVEHDMSVVFGLATKIAVIVQGELLAFGTPDAVRANPLVQQAYLGAVPLASCADQTVLA